MTKSNKRLGSKSIISIVVGIVLLIVGLFMIDRIGEDVPNDKIVVNQFPYTGELAVWANPGFNFQWFGTTTEYEKAFQFWFGSEGKGRARSIVFNDAGNGAILGSVRILLPRSPNAMEKIHTEFASQENLELELIAPTINKVITATGPLLSSYESYAAKKNDLIYFIEDQLRYGIYKTSIVEETITDPITGERKNIRKAERTPSNDPNENGWERQETAPFFTYKLDLAQLSVDNIEYDQTIIDQIKAQQDAAMAVQTSIAEAKRAEQDALKEEALGKQKVARARAEQMVTKEKAVVEAEQKRDVAMLEKEAAEYYRQKLILEGEGESQKKRLIMEADGALTQKLDALIQINKEWATAVQNYNGNWVPQTVMGASGNGGSGNDAANLIQLLTAQAAKDINVDLRSNN